MASFNKPRRRSRQPAHLIRSPYARSLHCEQLEDRRLLALITVTTDQDVVDFNDGVTSLREAIFAANIVPGADEIQFDFGHDGPATILLTQGELQITDSLTITGAGAELLTIDASGNDPTPDVNNGDGSRAFQIDNSNYSQMDVTFDSLTVTGGDVGDPNVVSGDGGGISSTGNLRILSSKIINNFGKFGGGIDSRGTLFVSNSEILNNSSLYRGAGINAVGGEVYIVASIFQNNTTPWRGGGIHLERANFDISDVYVLDNMASGGAGISITDSMGIISHSKIKGNQSTSFGAGIHIFGSTVTLVDSMAIQNVAGSGGGGLSFARAGKNSILKVIRSTFEGNSALGNGGGGLSILDGKAEITDSVISGNTTESAGGGIQTAGTQIRIVRSTVTGNSARLQSQFGSGGGIAIQYASTSGRPNVLELQNTIVAGNVDPTEMSPDISTKTFPKFTANITISTKYSLIGNNLGTTLTEAPVGTPDANGNLIGGPIHGAIDPLLNPLADNGGPTLTHALLPGSPALNAGDPHAVAGQNGVPLFDQRGAPFGRVAGGRIDIGAFETGPLVVDTLVDEHDGDYSPGDLSLREAIDLANRIPGANTIEFDPILTATAGPLPATILLSMGELAITDSLTINGLGSELLTIDANSSPGSIFVVDDHDVSIDIETIISGLTLTGATDSAISSTNSLTLNSMIIRGNESVAGGAIWMSISPQAPVTSLRVIGSILSENTSRGRDAGAIYFRGYRDEITIGESTISGNVVRNFSSMGIGGRGGGILIDGEDNRVLISGSSIEANRSGDGAGVYIFNRNNELVRIESSAIRNNFATNRGGGIFASNSILSIADGLIIGNQSGNPMAPGGQNSGAGLYIVGADSLSINNTRISENVSTADGGGIFTSKTSIVEIFDSTIIDNSSAARGGAVSTVGGRKFDIQRSTISGNASGLLGGGGIYASGIFSTTGNAFSITDSTISNNSTLGAGGAIGTSASQLLVSNSTISGNRANLSGGAFSLFGNPPSTTFVHSTITNNTADADNNGSGSGGGISGGPVTLDHSIVAGNLDNSGVANDIAGVVNSSYSLFGFGAQFLAPLADNGGPTLTHALLTGSPAINAGDPALLQGDPGLSEFDQRGAPFARVSGSRIDIGAYEFQPASGIFHGDFDGDGDGDGRDFLAWQRGYGKTGDVIQSDGDATGNQAVDGNDLAVWQATYGSEVSAVSSQFAATDAALEEFANLSAGVPTLFGDFTISRPDGGLPESDISLTEMPTWPIDKPDLQRQDRNTPPIFSTPLNSQEDATQFIESDDFGALDEVFAAL